MFEILLFLISNETFTSLIIFSDYSTSSNWLIQAERYSSGTWHKYEQVLNSLYKSCLPIFEFSVRELLIIFEVSATSSSSQIGTDTALLFVMVEWLISKTPFESAEMTPDETPKLSVIRHSEHVNLD